MTRAAAAPRDKRLRVEPRRSLATLAAGEKIAGVARPSPRAIAFDPHVRLGEVLAAIAVEIDSVRGKALCAEAEATVAELRRRVDPTGPTTRSLASERRPPPLDAPGPVPLPARRAERMHEHRDRARLDGGDARPATTIRIVIADDHRMVREALSSLLAAERDFRIVGEAGDCRTALELVATRAPDVLLLDVGLLDGSGLDVARTLQARRIATKVLVVSTHDDRRCVQAMMRCGAAGYVTKMAAARDLPRAIRAVAGGECFLSPEIARRALPDCAVDAGNAPAARLGPRERDVLARIADGEHSPSIAAAMGIAVGTVEVHRRNLMRKLDLHTVAALTKYALREGLTSP
ncbi:MAG: response regulator transcription factor [Casimicrobiaceae bacterium]